MKYLNIFFVLLLLSSTKINRKIFIRLTFLLVNYREVFIFLWASRLISSFFVKYYVDSSNLMRNEQSLVGNIF